MWNGNPYIVNTNSDDTAFHVDYAGKEIIVKPEKSKNMSWISSIFQKKEGGTFVGNLLRHVVNSGDNGNNRTLSDYLPSVRTEVAPASSTWLMLGGALLVLFLIFKKK